jgi:TolB-like protein
LPFTGGDGGDGETIAEQFSYAPALNNAFDPIPRTSISRAVGNEQNFQMGAGMTDPDTIAAIGKQLGARYVLAGNIAKLGNRNLLIISILKIDDLRQIAGSIQTYTRIEEIQGKLPEMARDIINATQTDTSGLTKLAVLPVERGGNIDAPVADTLAQILSFYLIRSGRYAVYPRTATLEQVQTEYKTQMTVAADENLVDMGKGDNPQFVLSVAARRLGEQNSFNASIINLESGVQVRGTFKNYNLLEDGIEVMGNIASELTGVPVRTLVPSNLANLRSTGRRSGGSNRTPLGTGVLNIIFGMGSYLDGDLAGGLAITAGYGLAVGLFAVEAVALDWDSPAVGIPATIGAAAAGLSIAYGFVRPYIHNRSPQAVAVLDTLRVTIVPAADHGSAAPRRPGLQLAYSLKF